MRPHTTARDRTRPHVTAKDRTRTLKTAVWKAAHKLRIGCEFSRHITVKNGVLIYTLPLYYLCFAAEKRPFPRLSSLTLLGKWC